MGSTSDESRTPDRTTGTTSTTTGTTATGLGRRDLIKRSAALGLISVPTMSFLASCASSGGGDEDKAKAGTKTAKNPLAVNDTAQMEFVLFDGGFGKEYAEDAVKIYEQNFPKAKVKFSATQKIQSTLQPRFNQGTPPDLIDNSGAEQMDMGVLAGKNQLADLTPLLDAPSYDDPDKKVRDTLRPGIVEMGQLDGDPVWIMYYAYTVYGVWYSQKALDSLDATYPETWDEMLAVCEKAKKKGIAGWTYAGKYPYYLPFSLYAMIGKVGGVEVLDAIDNLEPNAWKAPAVKACFEAYYELYKKGYVLKGTPVSTTSSRRPRGPRARRCSSRTAPGWRTSRPTSSPPTSTSQSPRRPASTAPTSCRSARSGPPAVSRSSSRPRRRTPRAAWSSCASCSARPPRRTSPRRSSR